MYLRNIALSTMLAVGLHAGAQDLTKEYKEMSSGNPISPCVFCADPTALVFEGRIYVYGTNDHQQFIKNGGEGDNVLWYDRPASVWNEALPIGNGRLGAMCYGNPKDECIQLNEATFWSGGPSNNNNKKALSVLQDVRQRIFNNNYGQVESIVDANITAEKLHGAKYQSVGHLNLAFNALGDISAYRRELDIDSALFKVRFVSDGVTYTREAFATADDQVIVMRLSANMPNKISLTASLDGELKKSTGVVNNNTLEMTSLSSSHEGVTGQVWCDTKVEVRNQGGSLVKSGTTLKVSNANEVMLVISMATNYKSYNDITNPYKALCSDYLTKIATYSYDDMKQRHVAGYKQLYDRVTLDLGTSPRSAFPTDVRIRNFSNVFDPELAVLYFQFGRYLLISSSRPGGQPATLQGLWNGSTGPMWDSKYTVNINTEMNYWPAEKCNLSETHEPLFDLLRDLSVTGSKTATDMYGCRGWVCHHNTDLWRITGVVDCASSGMWPMGGAWLTQHLWYHYLYTGDRTFLESVYDIMKTACEFYIDFMVNDPRTNYLSVCPSVSPENTPWGHSSTAVNGSVTMDNQIINDLFANTISAATILDRDQDLVNTLKEKLAQISPMRIGKYGQLQEWCYDWDSPNDHHRHVSHLYGMFPSNQISPYRTPELFHAAKTTLTQRGDVSTGWSMAWKINLWARLLDGDHAYKLLQDQLSYVDPVDEKDQGGTYPNLFDAHPPFQIDGNFGCSSGITEMLVQSHDGCIHLLPALPSAWKKKGRVTGICTVGGFEVELSWKGGKIERAVIKSKLGGNCRVRIPGNNLILENGSWTKAQGENPNPFFAVPDTKTPIIARTDKVNGGWSDNTCLYDFNTEAGGVYTIVSTEDLDDDDDPQVDDPLPPVLKQITIDKDGKTLTMLFDKDLAWTEGLTDMFSVVINNKTQNRPYMYILSDKIIVQLDEVLRYGDKAVVSYQGTKVSAMGGGLLEPFTDVEAVSLIDEPNWAVLPCTIEAENFFDSYGIQLESCGDTGGGQDVCYIDDNDWTEYVISNPSSNENYILSLRMASPYDSGKVIVRIGNATIATIKIGYTGGWQTYKTYSANVVIPAGKHYLRLIYTKGGTNINWLGFETNASGIEELQYDSNENGIEMYDLLGRRVENPKRRGLYISRGHKYVVR